MSIDTAKTEIPALEQNLKTRQKNTDDKIVDNATVDNGRLRVTYDAQTVDTKIKPSQK